MNKSMYQSIAPYLGWALAFAPYLVASEWLATSLGGGLKPALAQTDRPEPMATRTTVRPYSAVSAPEWDALFDRTSGWTGADGAYSMPLSGDERPGHATATLWTFNDTFIGEVDSNDDRIGAQLVRNTNALMLGSHPDPNQIQFFFGRSQSGTATAQVMPEARSERWFWPNDGLVVNRNIYVYALRMKPVRDSDHDGVFDYAYEGVTLLRDNLTLQEREENAPPPQPFQTYTPLDTPLYAPSTCDRGALMFGQAMLPNTIAAGAPNPDGYLYLYGVRNDLDSKKLIVARVLPEQIEAFEMYQYWDGQQWSPSITAAAPLADQLSSEFSVTPLPDGRYILVFQLNDFLSQTVAVRYGDSPVGPWGPPIPIWDTHDKDLRLHTFTYGAKAHSHLSQPGELLISYQVNTFKNTEQYDRADIYRPRFIRLLLTDTAPTSTAARPTSANQTRRSEADQLVAQAKNAPPEQAMNLLQQAVQIYQQIGDRAVAATTLNQLGSVYLQLGQYLPALQTFQQALAIHQDVHNRVQEGISLSGVGQVYDSQTQYAQALEFYQQALPIRKEVGDRCGEGMTLTRIGKVHANIGQVSEALENLEKALLIHQEVDNRPWEAVTLSGIGDIYAKQGKSSDARDAYRQALRIYEEMGDRTETEIISQRIEALP